MAQHGRLVVLVEDDDSLRTALERLLRAGGFETKAYGSAEAALADPDLDAPDCLVVDLCLPALSGLELVDSLRRRGIQAPVIAISAREEALVHDEIGRRGIEHFLAKPFLGSTLLRIIDAVLGENEGAANTLR